ncbi:MAG: hypothetical protein LC776_12350, partial [Acidobacteria bacterium]|nr:hypothetical protein [Acidobacteriota bacterium]
MPTVAIRELVRSPRPAPAHSQRRWWTGSGGRGLRRDSDSQAIIGPNVTQGTHSDTKGKCVLPRVGLDASRVDNYRLPGRFFRVERSGAPVIVVAPGARGGRVGAVRLPPVQLGDLRLRNRLVTSSSLLGYGAADPGLVPYGMSPLARFVPLERFGAVTTRT